MRIVVGSGGRARGGWKVMKVMMRKRNSGECVVERVSV